jgi:hypothetical protein
MLDRSALAFWCPQNHVHNSGAEENILSRGRDAYCVYERSEIIGRTTVDIKEASKARKWNRAIDTELSQQRKEWNLVPPSNMTITLHEDAGDIPSGLVLSVPHETARVILHKRLANILEHEVTIDAEIDSGIEDAYDAMNLGTKETYYSAL